MTDGVRARFLPRFVELGGQRCARALTAITHGAGEPAVARGELHTLAGEAGILGLAELARAAQDGERACVAWAERGEVAARAQAAIAVRGLAAAIRKLAPPARRVVVVDDSPLVADEVGAHLRADGWEVEAAADDDAAERLVRDWRPQVLLLDVNMPGAPLAELCARARAAATGGLAICLLSGASDDELTRQARAVGADGWVSKVAGMGVVVDRVRAMASAARAP